MTPLTRCERRMLELEATIREKKAEAERLEGDLTRCGNRVMHGERLLRWVKDECDLSGQMELSAEITAYLGEV